MASVIARPPVFTNRSSSPTSQSSINTSIRGSPTAVPNKHLPSCPTGPRPKGQQLATPPASPPQSHAIVETVSLLAHPESYAKINERPSVYGLSGKELNEALQYIASQPLPDTKEVFPWLHGLHPDNSLQVAFFAGRKKPSRRAPRCIRSLTIVKAGGDLSHSRLKGAIAPDELLLATKSGDEVAAFLDSDPRDGFSVRNFQIQAAKMATVSDIVVYGDDKTTKDAVRRLASRIAKAQRAWREKDKDKDGSIEKPLFSTYVLQDSFRDVAKQYPEIVAVDAKGALTGSIVDFFHSERVEMHQMSTATEISPNVWVGPTPDASLTPCDDPDEMIPRDAQNYDLFIEATDMASLPDKKSFALLDSLLSNPKVADSAIPQLEFPGSGSIMPPTWSQQEVDCLMETCAFMYQQASGCAEDTLSRKDSKTQFTTAGAVGQDCDGDSVMSESGLLSPKEGRRILLHCTDGYTETSLLALAYYMYANFVPVDRAYVELHTKHGRNFFSYPTDVALLMSIQPRILQSSPRATGSITALTPTPPTWQHKLDGSLPSRIMDYMYLGNLGHANNPGLLRELGIGQVLSVGEAVTWTEEESREWVAKGGKPERVLYVDGVQDNGVDSLTGEFERCLAFIEEGRKAGTATLVHCRVGVSRSATICIAEVMKELGMSFPRAYCFVRARRLNVIIQPHLRFSYELLKWEEAQCTKQGKPMRRELEWATISREIAAMNRPYSRQ